MAWFTAAFVGQLMSKRGLRPLEELMPAAYGSAAQQSPAKLNLMLDMFAAQVKGRPS